MQKCIYGTYLEDLRKGKRPQNICDATWGMIIVCVIYGTRASPDSLETHLIVRKWGDIGHLGALSPWFNGMMDGIYGWEGPCEPLRQKAHFLLKTSLKLSTFNNDAGLLEFITNTRCKL